MNCSAIQNWKFKTPNEKVWLEQAETAVAGASILSNESARDVSKHALRKLFKLTNNDPELSLNLVKQIKDFSARRHLMEMFRRTLVEVSSDNIPETFSTQVILKIKSLQINLIVNY